MTFDNYIVLLDKLDEKKSPIWGNMTAQHMVEHLIMAIKLSNGNYLIEECMYPLEKFQVLKKMLLSPKPMPRYFVNTVIGEGLKNLIFYDIDTAKAELKNEIVSFENYFRQNPNATPNNPTYGPLNYEEWIVFHNKHFTHHLTQFGLIEEL
jgi:oxepin-CoA hydrolase/3-oxo-5,6-dehydrosuberyl-CoA semialdehyde dehydrogenase